MGDNFERVTDILIRRGMAASPEQAVEMVLAGRVVIRERDFAQIPSQPRPTVVRNPEKIYRFNEPILVVGETSKPGRRIPRREFARRTASALALTPQDIRFLKSLRISVG